MARRSTLTTAVAAALVFGLAACGSDDGGDSGGGGGGGGGDAAGKVGVILPDTESSVRWENFDRPYLEAAFEDAGIEFDIQNAEGGRLQGQGLAQCLGDDGVASGSIAFLNGSPDDNNATLFSAGAHEVLDPMTQYTQVAEQAVPGWDNQEAATIFEQMYTQAGGN